MTGRRDAVAVAHRRVQRGHGPGPIGVADLALLEAGDDPVVLAPGQAANGVHASGPLTDGDANYGVDAWLIEAANCEILAHPGIGLEPLGALLVHFEDGALDRARDQEIPDRVLQEEVGHGLPPSRIWRNRLISARESFFSSIRWVIAGASEPPVSLSASDCS